MSMPAYTPESERQVQAFDLPIDALRQIANVALFASTDQMLPTLNAVRLDYTRGGGVIKAIATDRYVLAWERIEANFDDENEGPDDFGLLLELAGVTKAVKLLPRKPMFGQTVTLRIEEDAVTFQTVEGSVRVPIVAGEFVPRWQSLIPVGPTDLDGAEVLTFGLNPGYLAKLAKVRVDPSLTKDGSHIANPARISVRHRVKALTIDVGDTFSSIWMPVRLSTD